MVHFDVSLAPSRTARWPAAQPVAAGWAAAGLSAVSVVPLCGPTRGRTLVRRPWPTEPTSPWPLAALWRGGGRLEMLSDERGVRRRRARPRSPGSDVPDGSPRDSRRVLPAAGRAPRDRTDKHTRRRRSLDPNELQLPDAREADARDADRVVLTGTGHVVELEAWLCFRALIEEGICDGRAPGAMRPLPSGDPTVDPTWARVALVASSVPVLRQASVAPTTTRRPHASDETSSPSPRGSGSPPAVSRRSSPRASAVAAASRARGVRSGFAGAWRRR